MVAVTGPTDGPAWFGAVEDGDRSRAHHIIVIIIIIT